MKIGIEHKKPSDFHFRSHIIGNDYTRFADIEIDIGKHVVEQIAAEIDMQFADPAVDFGVAEPCIPEVCQINFADSSVDLKPLHLNAVRPVEIDIDLARHVIDIKTADTQTAELNIRLACFQIG